MQVQGGINMLTSIFKRVSAVAIAGTIITGTMAVPANAWTSTLANKTETAISEDFSSFSSTAVQVMDETPAPFADNPYITVNRYHATDNGNYPSGFKASIGDNNSLSLMGKQGARAVLYNKSGSTSVQPGDVITVTFKYKYDAKQKRMRVNLNDSPTSRSNFVYITSNGTNNDAKSYASDAGKARILSINMGHGRVMETEVEDGNSWQGPQISKDAWNAITITIDTANDDYEGQQTIKVQSGSNYFIGYYDADYTGDGDTTYDSIDNISSITFDTDGYLWGKGGTETAEDGKVGEASPNCWIDDISVKVTGDRPEYQSDLSNTITDEDFSNLTGGWSSGGDYIDKKTPLAGTSAKYSRYGTSGTGAAGYPVSSNDKALKISSDTKDHAVAVHFDADTTVTAGATINMSFDYYQTNQNDMYVMLQGLNDKGIAHKYISSTNSYGYSQGTNKGAGWYGPNHTCYAATADRAAIIATTGINEKNSYAYQNVFTPVYGHNGGNTAQNTFGTGKWYTIELSINTQNKDYGNKQTLSLKYKERGATTYTQEYLSYLDADATTIGDDKIDALTLFKGFDIGVTTANSDNGCTAYIDNVKAVVTRSGFEAWGAASEGHEEENNTFTPGQTMTIKAAADPALFAKKDSAKMTLFVALYDNDGRLDGLKAKTSEMSNNNQIIESNSFSTHNSFKTFLWETDTFSPNVEPMTFMPKINSTVLETVGCISSEGVYGKTADDTVTVMTGENDGRKIFTPQYVYNADTENNGLRHLSFSVASNGDAYIEADLLSGNDRLFDNQMFAVLTNGYFRFFGENIYTKTFIHDKWYLIDILLDSNSNKAKLYVDGVLLADADLPGYSSESVNGTLIVKKSWNNVYLDDISLTSDDNDPSVTFMSNSPYYANMISTEDGTIDTYSQNSSRFIQKLRTEGASNAVLLNSDGTENTDATMSANKYLRITTDEGKSLYYTTKAGTDTYLSSIASVDIENEVHSDTEGYYVYEQPDISKLKGSALDASFTLGNASTINANGFVQRDGDHFVLSNTNEEIKFWGTNLGGDQILMEEKDAEAIADRIAASGFNIVRIHNFDTTSDSRGILRVNPDTNKIDVDPVKMNKLCYLLTQLKNRGIYWYLDQSVSRPIYEQDEVDYHDTTSMFPSGFWNQSLINVQNEYSNSLLGYVNPYTGTKLSDDPALAMIDLTNEKEIFNMDLDASAGYYAELRTKFNDWLKTKYSSRTQLLLAWYKSGKTGLKTTEDPWSTDKPVDIMSPSDGGYNLSPARNKDSTEFLTKVQKDFCATRTEYLKNTVGVKCPISGGTAFGWAQTQLYYALSDNDYLSMHQYWAHPTGFISQAGVQYDRRSQFEVPYNTSDENDSLGLIGTLSATRVYGMPYVIDEWNLCPPNSHTSEGPMLMSAYSSLNNWNALHFAFGGKGYIEQLNAGEDFSYDNPFSSAENPIQTAVFPTASIMFQRGDVTEANSGYYSMIEKSDLYVCEGTGIWVGTHFLPSRYNGHLGLIGKTGSAYNVDGLSNGIVNDENLKTTADSVDSGDRRFVSSTNELTADLTNKFFTANTDGTQVVSGFIGGKTVSLNDIDFKINNDYATVSLTSIDKDNSSIKNANSLLLTLAGEAQPYGQISEKVADSNNNEIKVVGKAPLMTEQITGEITLKLSGNYSVYALTSSGERKKQVDITPVNGGFKFNVTRDMETMHFEIVKN